MECPSPIIVHRWLWEPKEQEQGIEGTTLRSSDCCSRSWRRSIGAVISDTSRPSLPMCTSSRPSRQGLISSRYSAANSGREPRPRLLTPPPHPTYSSGPNCRSNFQTVTCANPARLPRTIWPGHLSCNLVWRCPYLPSSCNYRAIL